MVDRCECWLADESATVMAGGIIAKHLNPGMVIFLTGQLGAGKTTITRGLLKGFGHSGAVKSPTYTLVEPYEQLTPPVYHFDLYRLGDPEELAYMGIRDYFLPSSLCLVEWADKGRGFLPEADLEVELVPAPSGEGEIGRSMTITGLTEKGDAVLGELCLELASTYAR